MTDLPAILLPVHLAATAAMTGLAWFVQGVHYPLYPSVGEREFAAYQARHLKGAGKVIPPIMLLELFTLAALLWIAPTPLLTASAVLLAVIWISTFAIQVPLHRRLETSYDLPAMRRLAASHWVRTIAWTARTLLVCTATGFSLQS